MRRGAAADGDGCGGRRALRPPPDEEELEADRVLYIMGTKVGAGQWQWHTGAQWPVMVVAEVELVGRSPSAAARAKAGSMDRAFFAGRWRRIKVYHGLAESFKEYRHSLPVECLVREPVSLPKIVASGAIANRTYRNRQDSCRKQEPAKWFQEFIWRNRIVQQSSLTQFVEKTRIFFSEIKEPILYGQSESYI
ncbi:hypothetical protein ACP70R_043406 [Stipagrostis hirtigluma subsp. patula]